MRELSPVEIIARAAAAVPGAKPRRQPPAKAKRRRETVPEPAVPRRSRFRYRVLKIAAATLGAAALSAWYGSGADERSFERLSNHALTSLSHGLGLTVSELRIEGRARTSTARIRKALGIRQGDPMLRLRLDDIKARLESLPWVRSASVGRLLPGTIAVRVVERKPIAVLDDRGKLLLVDATGHAFAAVDKTAIDKLLIIRGEGAAEYVLPLQRMLASDAHLARRVLAANRVGTRRWDLEFDNGVILRLPEREPEAAWRKFVELEHKHGLLNRGAEAVDLRLPDRLILQLPEGSMPLRQAPGENT